MADLAADIKEALHAYHTACMFMVTRGLSYSIYVDGDDTIYLNDPGIFRANPNHGKNVIFGTLYPPNHVKYYRDPSYETLYIPHVNYYTAPTYETLLPPI